MASRFSLSLLLLLSGCSLLTSTDDSRLDPEDAGGDSSMDGGDTGDGGDDGDVGPDGDADVPDVAPPDAPPDGPMPCADCDDSDPCTLDQCRGMECVYSPVDTDGDGAPARRAGDRSCSGGTDCDDDDGDVYPGADELCNDADDNCDGNKDEGCAAAAGDTCEDAVVLAPVAGAARATGNFADYGDDFFTICPKSGEDRVSTGPDAVFFIPVEAASDLVIDTIGSEADTVIAVATSCSSDSSGFRVGCHNDIDERTDASRIYVRHFDPETEGSPGLYILVDAADEDEEDDFVLNVRVSPTTADACVTPYLIGGGSVVGYLSSGTVYLGECQRLSESLESEAVFAFDTPPDSRAVFRAFSNDFVPDLYARNDCTDDADLRCSAGDLVSGGPFDARADLDVMVRDGDGTRHLLFVDGSTPGFRRERYLLIYDP